MKPLIIYIDSERDEIKLSRKQFEKFIQDAYQQGYDSGYQVGYRSNHYWPYITTTTSNSQPPNITYTTGTPIPETGINITCNSDTNSILAPGNKVTSTNSIYPGDNAVEIPCDAHNDL